MLLIVLLKGKSSSNLGTGKFVLLELLTFICIAEHTGGKKIPSSWGCSGVTGVGDYDGIFSTGVIMSIKINLPRYLR